MKFKKKVKSKVKINLEKEFGRQRRSNFAIHILVELLLQLRLVAHTLVNAWSVEAACLPKPFVKVEFRRE